MDMKTINTEKKFVEEKIAANNFKKFKENKILAKRILIMGLPGTGKTTLANELVKFLPIIHLNADEIRKYFDDWDFSKEGRLRQAKRMKRLSDFVLSEKLYALTDFVCPLDETRKILNPDIIIWMDTEKKGRYENHVMRGRMVIVLHLEEKTK